MSGMQGFLEKRASGLMRSWQRRFFRLDAGNKVATVCFIISYVQWIEYVMNYLFLYVPSELSAVC